MKVVSGGHLYQADDRVAAHTGRYNLHLCQLGEAGKQGLLQIATAVEHNGVLDRAAYILVELKLRADELEKDYVKVRTRPDGVLNYDLGFPELVDSFVCEEQGGRRVNVLSFRNVDDPGNLVPLVNITGKDRRRVDLKTSAWIMGKLLKLLVFAHSEGITVGLLTGNNFLIEPDQHYVLIFDWSTATIGSLAIPEETMRAEISAVGKAVITVLGGDLETGVFTNDGEEGFFQYTERLMRLAEGSDRDAKRAHERFYELVNGLWKPGFHPFTTFPLV